MKLQQKLIISALLACLALTTGFLRIEPHQKVQYISHHGYKYLYRHDKNAAYLVNVTDPEIKNTQEIEDAYFTCVIKDVKDKEQVVKANSKLDAQHNKTILRFFIENDKVWAVVHKDAKGKSKKIAYEYLN